MKKLLILMFLTVAATWSWAQQLEVSTDRENILIGEHVALALKIECEAADSVRLPVVDQSLHPSLEVLDSTETQTTYEGADLNQKVITRQYILTSFDTGYHAMAPLTAVINGDTIFSSPFLVAVTAVPIDTAKGIYDIRGVAEVPFSLSEWLAENWHYLVMGLMMLLLIAGLVYWFVRRKPAPPVPVVVPTRPPHEIAIEQLDALQAKALWQNDQTKAYYSELSEIIRAYIEGRFSLPAREQTSDEIMAQIRRIPNLDATNKEHLNHLLFTADLVKFAKEKPVPSENEQHLKSAYQFVNTTKLESSTAAPTVDSESNANSPNAASNE